MLDITMYGDNELSLIVFNDEWLYNQRWDEASLLETIKEYYIYTDDQLDELIQALEDDREEDE